MTLPNSYNSPRNQLWMLLLSLLHRGGSQGSYGLRSPSTPRLTMGHGWTSFFQEPDCVWQPVPDTAVAVTVLFPNSCAVVS